MSAKVYDQAEYIGDAVYASFDGYHIWLTTGDGNDQRIALEPDVLRALVEYEKRLRNTLATERINALAAESQPSATRASAAK